MNVDSEVLEGNANSATKTSYFDFPKGTTFGGLINSSPTKPPPPYYASVKAEVEPSPPCYSQITNGWSQHPRDVSNRAVGFASSIRDDKFVTFPSALAVTSSATREASRNMTSLPASLQSLNGTAERTQKSLPTPLRAPQETDSTVGLESRPSPRGSPASSDSADEEELEVDSGRSRAGGEPDKLQIDTTGQRYCNRRRHFQLTLSEGLKYNEEELQAEPQLLADMRDLSSRCRKLFPSTTFSCQKPSQLTYRHIAQCAFLHASNLQSVRTVNVKEQLSSRSDSDVKPEDVLDPAMIKDESQVVGMKTADIYQYAKEAFQCYSSGVEKAYLALESVIRKVQEIQQVHPQVYISLDPELLALFPVTKGKSALYTWKGFKKLNQSSIRHNLCNVTSEKPSRVDRKDKFVACSPISGTRTRAVSHFFSVSVNGKMKNTPWLMCWYARDSRGATLNLGMETLKRLKDALREDFFSDVEHYSQIKMFLDGVFERKRVFRSLVHYRQEFEHFRMLHRSGVLPSKSLEPIAPSMTPPISPFKASPKYTPQSLLDDCSQIFSHSSDQQLGATCAEPMASCNGVSHGIGASHEAGSENNNIKQAAENMDYSNFLASPDEQISLDQGFTAYDKGSLTQFNLSEAVLKNLVGDYNPQQQALSPDDVDKGLAAMDDGANFY